MAPRRPAVKLVMSGTAGRRRARSAGRCRRWSVARPAASAPVPYLPGQGRSAGVAGIRVSRLRLLKGGASVGVL